MWGQVKKSGDGRRGLKGRSQSQKLVSALVSEKFLNWLRLRIWLEEIIFPVFVFGSDSPEKLSPPELRSPAPTSGL